MIQYIVLVITFQLLFLAIYDLFLKKETFFQSNRVYLIGTFLVSLFLPFVKLPVFKTIVSQQYAAIVLDEIVLTANSPQAAAEGSFPWLRVVFVIGVVVAFALFVYKIYKIVKLKQAGEKQKFADYIKVTIPKSNNAFSFYNTVFMGDAVTKENEEGILEHELVHVKQKHTLDLLFFEVMRIALWFNPLVYIYQNRIAEVHEFIADSNVKKTSKKEQYELLLSQIFETKNISFINHFYKSSLIKKRIVMLQKSKSGKVLKLKYLALVPLVSGMLFYTSCETENDAKIDAVEAKSSVDEVEALDEVVIVGYAADPSTIQTNSDVKLIKYSSDEEADNSSVFDDEEGDLVAFSTIGTPPAFPGNENAENPRENFNELLNKHIRKNFRYPDEAQEKGIQGRVSIRFIIEEDGSVKNLQMRGPDKLLVNEAARIISRLPKFSPGMENGKAVKVPFSLPITFRLK
ncbi:M56 family metallopeptidase [Cellulophaga omnivescoria]|uniref:M56 family metallopeptidase n=1 Tax=Cellulophaga omnivescoria TaxID=1888890 RepID=UPI0022F07EDD|nr:M56 family metallopeptidase [Cellulophaga omnivescoria]WBU90219.1 M56 family metallopeptidase [Cellulophaga omnivescoria]